MVFRKYFPYTVIYLLYSCTILTLTVKRVWNIILIIKFVFILTMFILGNTTKHLLNLYKQHVGSKHE